MGSFCKKVNNNYLHIFNSTTNEFLQYVIEKQNLKKILKEQELYKTENKESNIYTELIIKQIKQINEAELKEEQKQINEAKSKEEQKQILIAWNIYWITYQICLLLKKENIKNIEEVKNKFFKLI